MIPEPVAVMLAVAAGGAVFSVWWCADASDDGVDVPLHRLDHRRGHAARIDPGVRLAQELAPATGAGGSLPCAGGRPVGLPYSPAPFTHPGRPKPLERNVEPGK